jgi:hypothetical protein
VTSSDVLIDAFGRIRDIVHRAVDGLPAEEMAFRIDGEANSIAWLVWHLTRIQDDHIADVSDLEQVWASSDWATRFDLPFETRATGFGHSSDQVAAVQVDSGELLTGYHDEVYEQTIGFTSRLTETDLDRIVDESWDPPVSLGVRLVSVISDNLQHAGQAAFVRGVLERK